MSAGIPVEVTELGDNIVVSAGVSVEITGSVLDEDLRTVMSEGISVEVTGSGIIELRDDSGTDMSAGVSIDITGSADRLSLMGLLVSVLSSAGSWGRGLVRLHCENVIL